MLANTMKAALRAQTPESCLNLLARLQRGGKQISANKLTFQGIGQRDVYNITAPFNINGQTVIGGRVESREVELSETVFFSEAGGMWQPIPGARTFPGLQDPCITFIGGELIMGGVRFPVQLADGSVIWRMEFYRGASLNDLDLFFVGPDKMKDIRLVELSDERVGVFTRPQGEKGGRGKIGFFVADNLEAITVSNLETAPLFHGQCRDEEWVGANEAHLLGNGLVGVLGHIAYFDRNEHRHYYPMVFCVDPRSGKATAPEIISRRSDFPVGPAKRSDLADVMFSGGLVRHGDGTACLYAGLSDAEAGYVRLPDPLYPFENSSGGDDILKCLPELEKHAQK